MRMFTMLSMLAVAMATAAVSAATSGGGCTTIVPSVSSPIWDCYNDASSGGTDCFIEAIDDCENVQNGTFDFDCSADAFYDWCEAMNDAYWDYVNCSGAEQDCLDDYCDAVNRATYDYCEYLEAGWCCVTTEAALASPRAATDILYVLHVQMNAAGHRSHYADGVFSELH